MLYAAKCYWPGITEADLEQVAERAAQAGLRTGYAGVAYLGSLLFAADGLVLCLFQGPLPGRRDPTSPAGHKEGPKNSSPVTGPGIAAERLTPTGSCSQAEQGGPGRPLL